MLCAEGGSGRGVGVFTAWSRVGLARWPTREGKNQWGRLAGEVAPRRLTKVGVGRNVEQQKLAVV